MKTFATSIAALMLAANPALAERTFGLVIGIDEYTYIPDLHGAVNDAVDIADALESLGATVTLLTDAEATRAAILGRWEAILEMAEPGDRLIVSYAGHGSNEPEQTPGSERDGRDENFLLAGFAPRGEASGQRIRDDEIADLLHRSAALDVIFVADACHAGTVTRNVNPTLGYRYVETADLDGDPLPPPPPPPGSSEGQDDIALFLAAVHETEKVPEVLIDGVPRGALSYAFASGLRGDADRNGDGVLTKGELEAHVRRTVREVSDGVQLPQSEPAGFETRALFDLGTRAEDADTPRSVISLPFDALPPVQVSGAGWADMSGTLPVSHGTLRRDGATVYSSVGDRVSTAADIATLQGVVDKHRIVGALRRLSTPPLSVGFDRGDRLYAAGEPLAIRIEGRNSGYLTLFNLGADGTLVYLYPLTDLGDPIEVTPSSTVDLGVEVTAPFGADHVIAVETDHQPTALRAALQDLDGHRDTAALWDVLRRTEGRIALFPFFTTEQAF